MALCCPALSWCPLAVLPMICQAMVNLISQNIQLNTDSSWGWVGSPPLPHHPPIYKNYDVNYNGIDKNILIRVGQIHGCLK